MRSKEKQAWHLLELEAYTNHMRNITQKKYFMDLCEVLEHLCWNNFRISEIPQDSKLIRLHSLIHILATILIMCSRLPNTESTQKTWRLSFKKQTGTILHRKLTQKILWKKIQTDKYGLCLYVTCPTHLTS